MTSAAASMVNTSTRHARPILQRLPRHKPIAGAEVGVLRGKLSHALLAHCPNLDTLYMVDRWEPAGADAASWSRLNREPCNQLTADQHAEHYAAATAVARRHHGRAVVIPAASLVAAESIPDGSLDFVFLDADHQYESVVADIAAWLPKLKTSPLSWIGGHDYDDTDRRIGWGPEVKRAVDEAAEEHGWTLETDDFFTWFAPVRVKAKRREVVA